MLGKVIGNYKLETEVGRGAHGVVYRALDQGRARVVAVKALHSALTARAAVNERLRQLAPSIAQLRHPQLAEFYTILQQGADLYLVTELIEGHTLTAQLRKIGVFSAEDAVKLLLQICEPLVWLGRANWAHGDLKPANVIVAPDGNARLTDLGLAYALGDLVAPTTESGLAYRAPEQLQGAGFDTRSDVYALGVIFYELVTGLLPFRRANDEALRQAHLHDPVPSPRNYFPLIPVAVEALLLRALAKDPAERFATVADFQTALQDWLGTISANAIAASNSVALAPTADAPDTLEGPAYEPSVETLRGVAPTIPELPPSAPAEIATIPVSHFTAKVEPEFADHDFAMPPLPDERRHTRPVKAAVSAAMVESAENLETSKLPVKTSPAQKNTVSPRVAAQTAAAATNQATQPNQAGFYEEVVVELDETPTAAPRKKGILWLAVAGLVALVGIPYAMMRNVDSTASPALPSRSTLNAPSPTPTSVAVATPDAELTPTPEATISPRAEVSPTALPKASPKAKPAVLVVPNPAKAVTYATPKPVPTVMPTRRITPTPLPVPTARQIYPPPTPMPTKKSTPMPIATPSDKKEKGKKNEEEKPKKPKDTKNTKDTKEKPGGLGGFLKGILKGKP